jgi:surface protein
MNDLFGINNSPLAANFNKDLNNWDVSKVTTMEYMFYGASAYNQPLNNWDVSKVIYMNDMFYGASAYNQPMNNWDVSNVINMNDMFAFACLRQRVRAPKDDSTMSMIRPNNLMLCCRWRGNLFTTAG